MRYQLTAHARRRWHQRIGTGAYALRRALKGAVQIPYRRAGHLLGRRWRKRYRGLRFYASSCALFVVRGSTVVTVIDLDAGQLGTILTWKLTGWWLNE